MKTIPLLHEHDINKIIGKVIIDEKFLPDHWYYDIVPSGRLTYDDAGVVTHFEILEFSLIPKPIEKNK